MCTICWGGFSLFYAVRCERVYRVSRYSGVLPAFFPHSPRWALAKLNGMELVDLVVGGGWLLLSLVVCSAGNAISVPVTVHHGFPVLCDFFLVIKFWLHFGSNNFVIVVVWITFVYQRA